MLTPGAVTQRNGVPMLYDTASSSNLPSPYLCLARNVLGRAPLTPCFVRGNRTPTLPHSFGNRRELWLTAGMELATAAGFMRSTLGCVLTAGDSHAGLLSPRRSCNGRLPFLTLALQPRRAADTMKRRREEQGEDYYRKPASGDGAASD